MEGKALYDVPVKYTFKPSSRHAETARVVLFLTRPLNPHCATPFDPHTRCVGLNRRRRMPVPVIPCMYCTICLRMSSRMQLKR
ncbi:hypothetical protein BDR03DRAFT_559955 [Suillus americanus]|nr:hypothetical protein BDR03DRAFT_559955 [Suillus americanus]